MTSEPVTDAIYYGELQARVSRVLERLAGKVQPDIPA
jgi:hypothetical protein